MLLAPSKRKRTIGVKEVEATVATMARIPPKTVSKDDAEVLKHLELTLKTVVYGQDKAIESCHFLLWEVVIMEARKTSLGVGKGCSSG